MIGHEEKYRILYQIEGRRQWVVLDEIGGDMLLKKELLVYDTGAIDYLMKHHDKHLARVVDYYRRNDGVLVVYEELINGWTLEEYMSVNIITEKEGRRIFLELCDGLMFLHSAKPPIIHRDLKPSNILITKESGMVVIVDYNAAKIANANASRDTVLIGTEGYAAPEQYGFASSDCRTDVYSLGVLARSLLGKKYRKSIERATQLDPNRRFSSVADFRNSVKGKGIVLNHILPLPGFRQGNSLHATVAVSYYFFSILFTIAALITDSLSFYTSGVVLAVLTCLVPLDIAADWTGLFMWLPLTQRTNSSVRVIAKTVWIMAAVFLAFVIAAVLDLVLEDIFLK